jgi:hypothetical protein
MEIVIQNSGGIISISPYENLKQDVIVTGSLPEVREFIDKKCYFQLASEQASRWHILQG